MDVSKESHKSQVENKARKPIAGGLSYCIVFVCQQGPLEAQAVLLAASLRRWVRCEHELVAAMPVPRERYGYPSNRTLQVLESLRVRIVEIENTIDPDYLIGNKVSCLGIENKCDRTIFLDTDILCMSEFHGSPDLAGEFAAKPADTITYGHTLANWKCVYAATGSAMPDYTTCTTISQEETLPYFNAGMIQVKDGPEFAKVWAACCRAIDAADGVGPKRPWLDQIALPPAISQLGITPQILTERYNFPAHMRPLEDESSLPVFCHYHKPIYLLQAPQGRRQVAAILEEHPEIARILNQDPIWKPILQKRFGTLPTRTTNRGIVHDMVHRSLNKQRDFAEVWHKARTPKSIRKRNILVTGIPRSGTSLFSALLNGLDGAVCLNEISPTPHLYRFFRHERKKINLKQPVRNIYSASGELSTNTIEDGTVQLEKIVPVSIDEFVLAQKWTLPYLNALPRLVEKGWPIWVVVRHPRYTISSWKRCPAHFAIANVSPADRQLRHISFSTLEADVRRIEIWNHFAKLIDSLRDHINIVRYEDLVADPDAVLRRFCQSMGLEQSVAENSLESRNHSSAYDDLPDPLAQAINERCHLHLFGYDPI